MGELMRKWFGESWRTTLGGILLGVPPVIGAAASQTGIMMPAWANFLMTLSMGVGGLLLGITAKDKTVHSTTGQVQQATQAKAEEASKDAGISKP